MGPPRQLPDPVLCRPLVAGDDTQLLRPNPGPMKEASSLFSSVASCHRNSLRKHFRAKTTDSADYWSKKTSRFHSKRGDYYKKDSFLRISYILHPLKMHLSDPTCIDRATLWWWCFVFIVKNIARIASAVQVTL